jgi:hypothetical protein
MTETNNYTKEHIHNYYSIPPCTPLTSEDAQLERSCYRKICKTMTDQGTFM